MISHYFKRSCLAAALLASVFSVSCATKVKDLPLSSSDRAAMRGKTVVVTKREFPAIGVITSGGMMLSGLTGGIGGAIVGGVQASNANHEVRNCGMVSPNETVSQAISKPLAARTGARTIPAASISDKYKPEELAAANPQADYILDVNSGWLASYYPWTFTKYYIAHGITMRLIDRSSGKVIASGTSDYRSNDKAHAPNYNGIYENNCAFIKQETKKNTDAAIAKFPALF